MAESVIVMIDHDHQSRLDELADQLRAAGMRVDQVLGAVGIITGAVTQAQRAVIALMPGVAQIEDQNIFQLPPSDSDLQ